MSRQKRTALTLEGRLLMIVAVATLANSLVLLVGLELLQDPWLAVLTALPVALLVSLWLAQRLSRSLRQGTRAIANGIANLLGDDFSITIAYKRRDEIGEIVQLYNRLTEKLRSERQSIYQRELLLDMVIQNAAMCVLLTDHTGRIVYSNYRARSLLNRGRPVNGSLLSDLLATAPEVLADMVRQERDGLFRVEENGDDELYHLSCGRFLLNAREHQLYLIKQMTRELHRQEAAVWKRVIRTISHELNNSLAPISSLAHSGALMVVKERYQGLPQVFATIAERADHLRLFIESYARIAKLPLPNRESVDWQDFIRHLAPGYEFVQVGELPGEAGFFDPVQLQQVLVNLLKNAAESGSEKGDIALRISQDHQQSLIEVLDRGSGMSGKVMENALLPFYTTKLSGSGIGLPLCREIVEGHDGELTIANREGGGLRVQIRLPRE